MNTHINLPDLTIAEVLRRWPETIPVFLAHRLDCLGCSMTEFETVAEAIQIYKLPRQQFLEELKNSLPAVSQEQITLEASRE